MAFTNTWPASSSSTKRSRSPGSVVHTLAPRPYGVSFASVMASSTLSTRKIVGDRAEDLLAIGTRAPCERRRARSADRTAPGPRPARHPSGASRLARAHRQPAPTASRPGRPAPSGRARSRDPADLRSCSEAIAETNRSVNASATAAATMKRLAAMHDWPLLIVRDFTAVATARCRSADGMTMNGSLPPSSSTLFFSARPARLATSRPARSLPVSVTALTRASPRIGGT